MKFEVTSFNTFEVMPLTRFHDAQTEGKTEGKTDVWTYGQTPVYHPPKLCLWGHKHGKFSTSSADNLAHSVWTIELI